MEFYRSCPLESLHFFPPVYNSLERVKNILILSQQNFLRNLSADKKNRGVLSFLPSLLCQNPPELFLLLCKRPLADERWSSATLWDCSPGTSPHGFHTQKGPFPYTSQKVQTITCDSVENLARSPLPVAQRSGGAASWKKCDICVVAVLFPAAFPVLVVCLCSISGDVRARAWSADQD